LEEALKKRSDATLKDLAKEFGVHTTTIFYACKKWNLTRKKNVEI
jgi:transposase-like protein